MTISTAFLAKCPISDDRARARSPPYSLRVGSEFQLYPFDLVLAPKAMNSWHLKWRPPVAVCVAQLKTRSRAVSFRAQYSRGN